MSTTKVTTGLITSLDSAKLTGSVDVARLPSTVLNSNVATTDLTSVHQGIATLGLHMGVADNKVAFNLPNSFIDVFQDSSGVTTTTDVSVNASEYVSSYTESLGTPVYVTGNRSSTITVTSSGFAVGDGAIQNFVNGTNSTNNGTGSWHFTASTPSSAYIRFQFSTAKVITEAKWHSYNSTDCGQWKWQGSNTVGGASGYVDIGSSFAIITSAVAQHTIHTSLNSNTTAYLYYQLLWVSGAVSSSSYHWEMEFEETPVTASTNATGTLISDAQTAAESTTELSGAFLYTDNAGTNTIGTDLKIYFTANNGGAWTEATSYGASQVFSGSIKQVKLGKTTVTAGTQIAIKAVWANQVATVAGAKYSVTSGMMSHTNMSGWNAGEVVDGAVTDGTGFFFASSNSTGEVRVDLGSSNDQTFNKIRVYISAAVNAAVWTIAYSDDNSSWTNTDLTTFAPGAGSFGAWFEGTWTNVGTHRYWKMFVSSGTGAGQGWASEIEWHTAEVTGKVAHLEGWAVNY